MLRRDWRGMTLRELTLTYEHTLLYDWDHTAAIRSTAHNAQLARAEDAREPAHFHPYRQSEAGSSRTGVKITKENWGLMKSLAAR